MSACFGFVSVLLRQMERRITERQILIVDEKLFLDSVSKLFLDPIAKPFLALRGLDDLKHHYDTNLLRPMRVLHAFDRRDSQLETMLFYC
jgi:hypothetical protein